MTLLADSDRTKLAIAHIVAEHWRAAAMSYGNERWEARWAAHPLACVLAALEGEMDPAQLGVEEGSDAAEALRALASSEERP